MRLVDYRNYVKFLSCDHIIFKFPVQKDVDHLRSPVSNYFKVVKGEQHH